MFIFVTIVLICQ